MSANEAPVTWGAREVSVITATVIAVAAGAWALWSTSTVWALLLGGVVVATAVHPAVDALSAGRMPRWLAGLLVFGGVTGAAAAAAALAAPLLLDQLSTAAARLPSYYIDLPEWLRSSPSRVARQIAQHLPASHSALLQRNASTTSLVGKGFVLVEALPGLLISLIAVGVVAYSWAVERNVILRALLLLAPLDRREGIRGFVESTEQRVGAFVRGQLVVCAAVGGLAMTAYLLLGLPHAPLLALFAGALEIVPFLGPALGALPAVLVALTVAPSRALGVVGAAVLIQMIENYLLAPRIVGRFVGVRPFPLLLAIAAFTSLLGVAGTLLAIPITAVLQLAGERLLADRRAELAASDARGAASALRWEAARIAACARRLVMRGIVPPRAEAAALAEEVEAVAAGVVATLDAEAPAPAREGA